MGKSFSITKLPIWGALNFPDDKVISEVDIENTGIEAYMDYLHLLDKELDSFLTSDVTTKEYEFLEENLFKYMQDITGVIKRAAKDHDIIRIKELEESIEGLIKKSSKKRQQRIKLKFANKLENLYKTRNYKNREDLELYLGVSQQTVSAYFNPYNPTMPGYEKLLAIAKFLDCSCDYLINEEVEETEIGYDAIVKETGLTSKSIDILRSLTVRNSSNSKSIIKTINILISNLYAANEYETDILSALSEYFSDDLHYDNDFYHVSGETLDNFKGQLNEVQTVGEARNTFTSFKSVLVEDERSRKYTYADTEILNLVNIQSKLVKLKSELKKEYEEELSLMQDIN